MPLAAAGSPQETLRVVDVTSEKARKPGAPGAAGQNTRAFAEALGRPHTRLRAEQPRP